jgi:hypothetical protein
LRRSKTKERNPMSSTTRTNTTNEYPRSTELQLIGYRADLMRSHATSGEQQVIDTLAALQQTLAQVMAASDSPVFTALKADVDIALVLARGNAERLQWILNGSEDSQT